MSTPHSMSNGTVARRTTVGFRRGTLAALQVGSDPVDALLIPGFTGSKEDFSPILPLLHDNGHSVMAVDLIGQHESMGLSGIHHYTCSDLAMDVLSLARTIGSPVHLVGHSMGGLICQEAVLDAPELFCTFTLLDTGPGALPDRGDLDLLAHALPAMSLSEIWDAKSQMEEPAPDPEVQEFLRARWLRNHPDALDGMISILRTAPDRTTDLTALGSTLPMQVVFGRDDNRWSPAAQSDMANRMGVPAVSIPGAAHSPAVENPPALARVLHDFWRSRSSRA